MKKALNILLILWTLGLSSQHLDKANSQYEDYNYVDAAKLYQKIAKSGYVSDELYKKLGNIYYFNGDYIQAEEWYSKLDAENKIEESEYQLRYAQTLKSVGKSGKAEEIYDRYLNTAGALDETLSSSLDYAEIIRENDNRYSIFPLEINAGGIDYGAFIKGDTLYFSSSRSLGRKKIVDGWSGKPFLDLYTVGLGADGKTLDKPQAIKGKVNTKLHESSAVITKDGNTMYFTRSNTTPRLKVGKNDKQKLKIYRAKRNDEKWGSIEDLSINSDTYSNAHPALSSDEKTLYFVSDMPESYGATDIFMVNINGNGSLGKPINMGTLINTKGRESFPFLTKENELYFSSDGHLGLGGYDIFYVNLQENKRQLLNIGLPLNGPHDDYAFSINNTTKGGVFSSNRSGTDNIYSLLETIPIKRLLYATMNGTVTEEGSGEPIADVDIELIGMDDETLLITKTDNIGRYTIDIDKSKSYRVELTKQGYSTTGKFVKSISDFENANFEMAKNQVDLRKLLNFENVYFDYNSSYLKKVAKEELDKIARVLNAQINSIIQVNSYADSRGSKKYNKWLSQRRTQRIIEYLITKKVNSQRLLGSGYGEEDLVNDCTDGTNCPEQQHRLNRRTEFIVK